MYGRGDVVKAPDPFGSAWRPWLALSDTDHPFYREEAIYVAITTTERADAIEINDSDFASGGLPQQSFVSPWVVMTLKHDDVMAKWGELHSGIVDDVCTETTLYIDP